MVNKWGFIIGCVLAFATVFAFIEFSDVSADSLIVTYPNFNSVGVLVTDVYCKMYFTNVTMYALQYSLNSGSWVNISVNRKGLAKLGLQTFDDGDTIDFRCVVYMVKGSSQVTQTISDYGTMVVNNSGYYFHVINNGFDMRVKELSKPYVTYKIHVPYPNLTVESSYVDCGADGSVEYLFEENNNDIARSYSCMISRYSNKVALGYVISRDNDTIQFPESKCDSDSEDLSCVVQQVVEYEISK